MAIRHLLFGLGMVALICGCGGGGGGGTDSGPVATLQVTDDSGVPVNAPWVAFRDGDGGWWRVQPSSAGVYTCRVSDSRGRYSFALLDPRSAETTATVYEYHYTLDESTRVRHILQGSDLGSGQSVGRYTVRGAISGSGEADECEIAVGGRSCWVDSWLSSYEVRGVPAGECTLAAVRHEHLYDGYDPAHEPPDRMVLHRGQRVGGDSVHDIDFSGPDAFDLTPYRITLVGDDATLIDVTWTPAGSSGAGCLVHELGSRTSHSYWTVPRDRQMPGDVYCVYVSSMSGGCQSGKFVAFSDPSDIVVDLNAPPFDSPQTSAPSQPGAVPIFTWEHYPGAAKYALRIGGFYWEGSPLGWYVEISRGWLEGSSTRYAVTDLDGASGWPGGVVEYSPGNTQVFAFLSNVPLSETPSWGRGRLEAGAEVTFVGKMLWARPPEVGAVILDPRQRRSHR